MTLHFIAFCVLLILIIGACEAEQKGVKKSSNNNTSTVTLMVLGNVQDGGSPHIGCTKACCADLFKNPDQNRKVVSLGLVDHEDKKTFLFEATPDISEQLNRLQSIASFEANKTPDGIFITHAHIGHYSGLMYLGREALGGKQVPVFVMPRMQTFLTTNGPWDQLVALNNIQLHPLQKDQPLAVSQSVRITPFTVPHRDEYSETVGFLIKGPNKSALFIPDINKWHIWDQAIIDEIAKVDFAFLDATFYSQQEIPHRNMSEIPHPFVEESLKLFKDLSTSQKNKVYFIHLNHTNPLLNHASDESMDVRNAGFHIARMGQTFEL